MVWPQAASYLISQRSYVDKLLKRRLSSLYLITNHNASYSILRRHRSLQTQLQNSRKNWGMQMIMALSIHHRTLHSITQPYQKWIEYGYKALHWPRHGYANKLTNAIHVIRYINIARMTSETMWRSGTLRTDCWIRLSTSILSNCGHAIAMDVDNAIN